MSIMLKNLLNWVLMLAVVVPPAAVAMNLKHQCSATTTASSDGAGGAFEMSVGFVAELLAVRFHGALRHTRQLDPVVPD